MRVEKQIVHSPQTSEVETNSIMEERQESAGEFSKEGPGQNHESLKKHGAHMLATTNLSGILRYRSLQNQLNNHESGHTRNFQGMNAFTQTQNVVGPTISGHVPPPTSDELGQAAASGDLKKVQDILAAGVDVNVPDSKGLTPLMYAAQAGKLDVMNHLIANNAKLDVTGPDNKTATYYAAENGRSHAVALLRQNKANPNIPTIFGTTPVMIAARNGDDKSVKILSAGKLSERADVNMRDVNDGTALHEAAGWGNAKTVKALLDEYADFSAPTNQGRTPLMEASLKGKADSTKLLLDRIAQVGDKDMRNTLLNGKDEQGRTALMDSAKSGDEKTVQELLKNKEIKIDEKDNAGRTALLDAAEKGNSQSVDSLLAKGANINHQDQEGRSVLMEAAENGNSVSLITLLKKKPKPDINLQDTKGRSALMEAVSKQDLASVKALLAAGARLDLTSSGKTAVMIAADKKNEAIGSTGNNAQQNSEQILKLLGDAAAKRP